MDVDPERAGRHLRRRFHGDGPRHLRVGGPEDELRPEAFDDGPERAAGGPRRPGHDEDVDRPDVPRSQRTEQPAGRSRTIGRHDGRGARSPEPVVSRCVEERPVRTGRPEGRGSDRDGDHGDDGGDGGRSNAPTRGSGNDDRGNGEREHQRGARRQPRDVEVGGPARDAAQPLEHHAGGNVEEGREDLAGASPGVEDAGERPGGETPHHQRTGDRAREHIGGDGDDRHRTEDREQHREDGQLRGDRCREDLRHPRPQSWGDHRQADACGDREREPDGVNEQGIDEDETRHRDRQHPERRHVPPERPGEDRDPRHPDGARHGRLPTGHRPEDHQRTDDRAVPRAESDPP